MSNLLDRLRGSSIPDPLLVEAADVLDYLEAQVRLLEDALATARAEITQNAVPVVVPDVLPRSRLIRIDTISNTVRIECVDKVGRETLSGLVPFDGTTAGLFSALAAAQKKEDGQ